MTLSTMVPTVVTRLSPLAAVGLVLLLLGGSQAYEAFDRWSFIEEPTAFGRSQVTLVPSFLPGDSLGAKQELYSRHLIDLRIRSSLQDHVNYLTAEEIRDDFRQGLFVGVGGLVLIGISEIRRRMSLPATE